MPRSRAVRGGSEGRSPRRSPSPETRQRDAERTRQRILDAAVEEFSAKGFAGARVAEIAARAGVNAQLIAYYFGGKQGLYDTLRRTWESEEAVFATPENPFPALIGAYLDAVCDHPSWARLLIWQALGDGSEQKTNSSQKASMAEAVDNIRRRQDSGELTKAFDPEVILTVLWSAVMAPITMPSVLQQACGADFDSPEFRTQYLSQLKRLFMGTQM
ncbi:MAG: TetR/AcrR family transcriptional regulator [Ktedonobacterales bacterium]